MGSKTKLVTTSIKDNEVKEDNFNDDAITTAKFAADSVESSEINDGTVTADDLASSLDLSSKTLTLPTTAFNTQNFNISLLGFKMAVNENLTVFNLVDGVVDEFHDESGTDEAEGSNDLYCATSDYYINSTTPDASPSSPGTSYSAGFSMTAITEPDTSAAGTNPAQATATKGTFTVPSLVTSVAFKVWGAGGGGGGWAPEGSPDGGGGGGFTSGNVAVTGGQVLGIMAGEGGLGGYCGATALGGAFGSNPNQPQINADPGISGLNAMGGGFSTTAEFAESNSYGGGGAGLAGITGNNTTIAFPYGAPQAPNVITIAGGGGGGSGPNLEGGAGGGLTGDAGNTTTEQTNQGPHPDYGGGGDQEQGGQ